MGYKWKSPIPYCQEPEQLVFTWDQEYTLLQRLLALRKEVPCRVGLVLPESGRIFISGAPGDPLGEINRHENKHYYPLHKLACLLNELEGNRELHWLDAPSGPYHLDRIPAKSSRNTSNKTRKIA